MIGKCLTCLTLLCTPLVAQDLTTRPERTEFRETSRYADVMRFIEALPRRVGDLHIHRRGFGYSMEGRELPLVIVSTLDSPNPASIHESGLVRVFVQANIHAGEVDGKEALLKIMREISDGEHRAWFDDVVLLIAPIYNADGNERIRLTNRPRQHGPVAGMGQRPNAQGLDLNRDHMKLESPEARSLVGLMNEFDPHVLIDLHTTNGTIHGYHLTYSPPLHPNTAIPIDRLLRDRLLPSVTRQIESRYGWYTYHYGNIAGDDEQGWYTFDHRPRFNNNYVGLRNRIAILSESYSYASFEDRILASERFVEAILDYVADNPEQIATAIAESSVDIRGSSLALSAQFPDDAATTDVLLGGVVEQRNPYSGEPMLLRTDAVRPTTVLNQTSFTGIRMETVPRYYLIPAELEEILALLETHGVRLDRAPDVPAAARRFRIGSTAVQPREFQGHRERALWGRYVDAELPPGNWVAVPMDQELARLAFYLLEPGSDDGIVNWNFLDEEIENSTSYPILRIP